MTSVNFKAVALFVVLAYGISWLIWAPLWLPAFGIVGLPVLPFHHALGAYGPFLAAFAVVLRTEGRSHALDLLRRLCSPGPSVLAVLLAFLGPVGLVAVGMLVAVLSGQQVDMQAIGRSPEFPAFSLLAFFLYNLLSFGIGEETGWRGYLLPRLQARWSALTATTMVAVVWAGWHAPLFLYRPGYVAMELGGAAGWLLSLATGAVLTTALFNASRGSVLVAAIFHAAVDVAFTGATSSPLAVNVAGALITVAGIVVIFVLGPENLSRSPRTALPKHLLAQVEE